MRRAIILSVLLFTVLFVGCSYTRTTKNDVSDYLEGQKVAETFYKYQKIFASDSMVKLFDSRYVDSVGEADLRKQFSDFPVKLGSLKSDSIILWKTFSTNSLMDKSSYYFVFQNSYDKGSTLETFRMQKSQWGKVKIVDYTLQIIQ